MKFPTIFRRRSRAKSASSGVFGGSWQPLMAYRGRHGRYHDHEPGSWQRDVRIEPDQQLRHHAVFACMSQIASDVAKMRLCLKQLNATGGYWSETTNPAYSAVLAKPNAYQLPGQFIESWLWSKLGTGNFYALKQYDSRNVVNGIYPLDPFRCRPMIANDGSGAVFYELQSDNLTPGLTETVFVPARYMIHDRYNTAFHPFWGVSPLYAATASAAGGLAMVRSSARFFQRGAKLSGVLAGPGQIDPDTAKRLEDRWAEDFEGEDNSGKIAVLGSGLKFESMMMSMVDSEITDQMEWSATQICSVFAMPPWKIGLGDSPRGIINVQALAVDYLSGCLQRYVESIEACLTLGLGLSAGLKVSLDETGLLRMDQLTLGTYLSNLTGCGLLCPNEGRAKLGLPPVEGGDTPYMQVQNYALSALAKRDAVAPAPGTAGDNPPPPPKALPPPMNAAESAAWLATRPAPEDEDDE
jgi:HK97 family phage portal protein